MRAVITDHLQCDLIKFYGVADTDFLYWFYTYNLNHSKFGLEKINGQAKGYPFDINAMKSICQKASDALDVKIYGGDCIVDKNGEIKIIDFNDWPSFAPCRKEASQYIAQCINYYANKYSLKLENE